MVEIGGRPILWHILKNYSNHGIHDFIICLGYRGYMIKEYFANYFLATSDVTFDMRRNRMVVHQNHSEPWKVTLVDTGENTMTAGRLKRVSRYLDSTFCLTYGDGVSDIDVSASIKFHRSHGRMVTLAAVHAPSRFGVLEIENHLVRAFREKVPGDAGWINGGFFVIEPKALEFISGDLDRWEDGPLQEIARAGQVAAFKHHGFWHAMDTMRDKGALEELWRTGKAPWKTWE